MSKNNPQNATIILREYAPAIIDHLLNLADQQELSNASRDSGIGINRLSEMAHGNREITYFYLRKMYQKGIITLKQILKDKKLESLPEDHQDLFYHLKMSDSLIAKLRKAERMGIDFERILDVLVDEKKNANYADHIDKMIDK